MRILIIIVLILVIAGVIGYFQAKTVWDKIKFDFAKGFRGINLSSFNPQELLLSGQTKINPILGIDIINDNSFDIPFKEMKATVYYNGAVIGETSSDLYGRTFNVPRHSTLSVTDPINLYLNEAGGRLLLAKIGGGQPELNYQIKVKIQLFGFLWIPITYKDTFSW